MCGLPVCTYCPDAHGRHGSGPLAVAFRMAQIQPPLLTPVQSVSAALSSPDQAGQVLSPLAQQHMALLANLPRMLSYTQDSPALVSNGPDLNGAEGLPAVDAAMEGAPDTEEFQTSDDHDCEVSSSKPQGAAKRPFRGTAPVAVKKKVDKGQADKVQPSVGSTAK